MTPTIKNKLFLARGLKVLKRSLLNMIILEIQVPDSIKKALTMFKKSRDSFKMRNRNLMMLNYLITALLNHN